MKQKQIQTYFLMLLGFSVLWCGLLVGVSWAIDPYQLYHKSFWMEDKFIANTRYQNAGLINRLLIEDSCCEAVIMGSSFSQNFLGKDISSAMGWNGTLNLAMDGSIPSEQLLVLEKALQSKRVKHVLWEVYNAYSNPKFLPFNQQEVLKKNPWKYFPSYLYDKKIQNDVKYLFSVSVISQLFVQMFNGKPAERVYYWYDEVTHRFNQADSLKRKHNDLHLKTYEPYKDSDFATLDKTITKTIAENPDVNFLIFIPPFSSHYYGFISQPQYQRQMDMRAHLIEKLAPYKNAQLYSFDQWVDIVEDLNKYSDLLHFNAETNSKMAQAMAKGQGKLTAKNTERKIKAMTTRLNHYIKRQKKDITN